MILGICECGCSKNIKIRSNDGYLKRYEWGHNRMFKQGKDNPSWKGGKYISKGYIHIKQRSHPFADNEGYVHEHRLVMEKQLGRYLKPTEEIHHINKNKLDNRIENLQLMSNHSEHMRTHYKK